MKRGEIRIINLDPTVGAEIRKSRPAVIVNADELGKLPLKIIVPVTDWKDQYSIGPLDGKNRSKPQKRFNKKIFCRLLSGTLSFRNTFC